MERKEAPGQKIYHVERRGHRAVDDDAMIRSSSHLGFDSIHSTRNLSSETQHPREAVALDGRQPMVVMYPTRLSAPPGPMWSGSRTKECASLAKGRAPAQIRLNMSCVSEGTLLRSEIGVSSLVPLACRG